MLPDRDLHWIAGLLEGEGCFSWSGHQKSGVISLQMSDRDTVERAHAVLGATQRIGTYQSKRPNRKPLYRFHIVGTRAAGWMMTLWPLLGQRRQIQIEKALLEWRNRPARPSAVGRHHHGSYERKAA